MSHEKEYIARLHWTTEQQEFIEDATPKLQSQLKRLKAPVSWYGSHNIRRSKSVMNQIWEQRMGQIADIERVLGLLANTEDVMVSFEKDREGKIIGFSAATLRELKGN